MGLHSKYDKDTRTAGTHWDVRNAADALAKLRADSRRKSTCRPRAKTLAEAQALECALRDAGRERDAVLRENKLTPPNKKG